MFLTYVDIDVYIHVLDIYIDMICIYTYSTERDVSISLFRY